MFRNVNVFKALRKSKKIRPPPQRVLQARELPQMEKCTRTGGENLERDKFSATVNLNKYFKVKFATYLIIPPCINIQVSLGMQRVHRVVRHDMYSLATLK